MQLSSRYIITFLSAVVLIIACKKEEEPQPTTPCKPTYTADIKTIIDAKCALSGCHDGSVPLPNFNKYPELKARVDNGKVKSFVFDLKIMPPSTATQLTDEEKELLQCWLDNGAPEN